MAQKSPVATDAKALLILKVELFMASIRKLRTYSLCILTSCWDPVRMGWLPTKWPECIAGSCREPGPSSDVGNHKDHLLGRRQRCFQVGSSRLYRAGPVSGFPRRGVGNRQISRWGLRPWASRSCLEKQLQGCVVRDESHLVSSSAYDSTC
jgi:hypothetical protein